MSNRHPDDGLFYYRNDLNRKDKEVFVIIAILIAVLAIHVVISLATTNQIKLRVPREIKEIEEWKYFTPQKTGDWRKPRYAVDAEIVRQRIAQMWLEFSGEDLQFYNLRSIDLKAVSFKTKQLLEKYYLPWINNWMIDGLFSWKRNELYFLNRQGLVHELGHAWCRITRYNVMLNGGEEEVLVEAIALLSIGGDIDSAIDQSVEWFQSENYSGFSWSEYSRSKVKDLLIDAVREMLCIPVIENFSAETTSEEMAEDLPLPAATEEIVEDSGLLDYVPARLTSGDKERFDSSCKCRVNHNSVSSPSASQKLAEGIPVMGIFSFVFWTLFAGLGAFRPETMIGVVAVSNRRDALAARSGYRRSVRRARRATNRLATRVVVRNLHRRRAVESRLEIAFGQFSVGISELLAKVEEAQAASSADAEEFMATLEERDNTLSSRVNSMSPSRVARGLRSARSSRVSERHLARRAGRQARRQRRAWNRSVRRFAAGQESIARWAEVARREALETSFSRREARLEKAALARMARDARRGEVNLRCVEGTREFEWAGKARSELKARLPGLARDQKVAEQNLDLLRQIERSGSFGKEIPAPSLRSVLIDRGTIRAAVSGSFVAGTFCAGPVEVL